MTDSATPHQPYDLTSATDGYNAYDAMPAVTGRHWS